MSIYVRALSNTTVKPNWIKILRLRFLIMPSPGCGPPCLVRANARDASQQITIAM